jgi:hypothetical protein
MSLTFSSVYGQHQLRRVSCSREHTRFLSCVFSSQSTLNSHFGRTASHPSIIKGLPPTITWINTSFSNSCCPRFLICCLDTRCTHLKLGVRSTRPYKSRSGDIGSNLACGWSEVGIPSEMATALRAIRCGLTDAMARRFGVVKLIKKRCAMHLEICENKSP